MASCKVQSVPRASSDQLLRKFADLDSEIDRNPSEKAESNGRRRRKRSRTASDKDHCESPTKNGSLVERKLLLPPANRRSALIRQLRIGPPVLRSKEMFIGRSLMAKIEKTWRKTVEGASKIFIEKHCNQHVRLRNEFV
ncbi:uncharacterized protein LOC131243126 [Magnolia sinica]|uniref:uncharacterized protein LOC131243126 n=1 Tax=Magnolia sinica TaxID=86752 RepID=UPI00265810B5|nr:uncharacterized protein LOC131243126 [Magnolia sinica]